MNAGAGPAIYLSSVSARDVDLRSTLSYDKEGTGGGAYTSFIVRRIDTSDYRATIRNTTTAVTVQVRRMVNGTETVLGQVNLAGGGLAAGEVLHVRVQAVGASPTTVRTKVWRDGAAEPGNWTVSVTDTTAALQNPGAIGLYSYLSGSATNAPIKAQFGPLSVVPA